MSVRTPNVSLRHALLAVAVMAVWGTNFVVIHIGLQHLPPLMFAALRFTAALLPAVLFIPRPAVPWRNLAAYGLLIGVGQFGILFIAMNGQITPALASLVVQTQVFFTVALAAYQNGERVRPFQFAALTITTLGLVLIMAHTDASTTPLGLALVLLAALSWAFGNMVIRSTPNADMLGYVVWASIFSIPPLLATSFLLDGWPAIRDGIAHAAAATWGAVLWQGWGNTLFGFAVWGWLLGRYPVAAIAPMSLLVPVFGFAASAIWLAEPMQAWKLEATALVLLGLIINFIWPKISAARRARAAAVPA
jgi:O-acetylserine/cysteine efflux transporter